MKDAAGLNLLMDGCATKLRSFGAMHATQYAAPHREIERAGRWNSDRARNTAEAAVLNQHYLKVLSAEVCRR